MNISRIVFGEMGSYYFRNGEDKQGCNLLQAKGGSGIYLFFANTPGMQYFKGRLSPTFTVPLNDNRYKYILEETYLRSQFWP